MRVRINGPFRVKDDDGTDITPVGMKERAMLALVLLSPGQRRTRVWLQDKLWSDRDTQQGSGSLRQALSNIRKTLGKAGDRLKADRYAIWLDPEVAVSTDEPGEFLDDIDVRDPEFSAWLRDQRQAKVDTAPDPLVAQSQLDGRSRATVLLRHTDYDLSSRITFLTRALSQRIAGDLALIGEMDVLQSGPDVDVAEQERANVLVELETYGEGDVGFMMIRVTGLPSRRTVWSGRLSISPSISDLWDAPEATRLVNQTVRKVADLVAAAPHMAHQLAFHRAVRRVYEYERDALAKADEMFASIQDGELRGLALAWRSFIRLTYALEFRDSSAELVAEASAFADEALRTMIDHPVVLALTSQVRLKLEGDLEVAHYLALRAAEIADQNPYALDALSQTFILHGQYEQANDLAQRARVAAQGMDNAFSWDMQACLTSLSLLEFETAFIAARECHHKMPFYRPALRYLVALAYLTGVPQEAEHFAARLRRLEPDFTPKMLLQPDYPLETLRALGLVEKLRTILS
ncbi:MAG: hypothetical protein ACK47C_05795 [Paracoccaceae bacterium]